MMTVVGFNFTRLSVERKGSPTGKISINNNVQIKGVSSTDLFLGKNKQEGLKFEFQFTSAYEPDLAEILMSGEILYMGDAKMNEEVIATWKKDKKIKKEILAEVLNTALMRSSIEALFLSREFNLPPPIPVPKVEQNELEKDYIG